MDSHSINLKQALIEHCNFVYLSLMLLFRSSNYPRVKESKKSADFILENIIENTFILMQGENTLLERRPKFKSNRFGSIYEFRRVCNTCGLQQYMTIIKKIEHA